MLSVSDSKISKQYTDGGLSTIRSWRENKTKSILK